MYIKWVKGKSNNYLYFVKSERVNGKPRQKTLLNLGTAEELAKSKFLQNFKFKLEKFLFEHTLVSNFRNNTSPQTSRMIIGPSIVFETLWSKFHIDSTINDFAIYRKFDFNIERTIFALTLQRILDPSTNIDLISYLSNHQVAGCDDIQAEHRYRAMSWLGGPLEGPNRDGPDREGPDLEESEPADGGGAPPADPAARAKWEAWLNLADGVRTTRDRLEEALFVRRSNLLTLAEHAFIYPASVNFESLEGLDEERPDGRPDPRRAVVGAVMDSRGCPIRLETWRDDTAASLAPVARRLRTRFGLERVCLVADGSMIGQSVISGLDRVGWEYIFGVKITNTDDKVSDLIHDESPYIELVEQINKKPDLASLQNKEIFSKNNRYIIYFVIEETKKGKFTKLDLINMLKNALALENSNGTLISNFEYEKFIANIKNVCNIDPNNINKKEKFDALYILRTNLTLDASLIALQYKRKSIIESLLRSYYSYFDSRLAEHQDPSVIRGDKWIDFLAFMLKKSLIDAMNKIRKNNAPQPTWDTIKDHLMSLAAGVIESDYKNFQVRTEAKPETNLAFRALGLIMPRNIIELPSDTELMSDQNEDYIYQDNDK